MRGDIQIDITRVKGRDLIYLKRQKEADLKDIEMEILRRIHAQDQNGKDTKDNI